MTEAKDRFIKELKGILSKYPVDHLTGSVNQLDERQELQLSFRNAEQYRLGALLIKWTKSDAQITDEEIAKTYFKCVLGHFKTVKYGK